MSYRCVTDCLIRPCDCHPRPAAPEAPKCPDCGKPSGGPGDVHTCTPPLAGLDFEKAMKDAREYKGMGFGVANTYEAFLNAQLREAVERAVAKLEYVLGLERAERQHHEDEFKTERERHRALRAAVRALQVTPRGIRDDARWDDAASRLMALDLGPEGE